MNKNSIITFNFGWSKTNYGAILTNYALQEILKQECYQPTLNFDKDYIQELTCKNQNIFKDFSKNISLIDSKKNIFTLNNMTNIFFTGSDQVFRLSVLTNQSHIYLLDFAKRNSKKIAFSASFGINKEEFLKENSVEIIELMKNSIKSFDFISVREKSGVEICKEVLGVDAEWIIDPVFIYNNWDELLNNATNSYKNNIISYVLDSGREYKKIYKYLEKKYKTKVIETANSNISVENWLKSIKDCELFITDSFHGMCFAIIFNKPFICVANKSRGSARFDSICEMLGIENQCLDSIEEIYQKDCVFKIDYNNVNKRIEEERQRGLGFLKKVLDAPLCKQKEKEDVRTKYLEHRVCELEQQANLKYQIKKSLWNLWLIIWHKYLPKSVKNLINIFRGKNNA